MAVSKSGSPITIDGGGSVSIDFDDNYYKPKPGEDPDDHEAAGTKLSVVRITTSSGEVDFSPLLSGDLTQCQIEISHKKPKGTITIKASPVGVDFAGKAFKKGQHPTKPRPYYSADSTIESVDFVYDGGTISFDKKSIGKGKVYVDKSDLKRRPTRRRPRR